MDAHVWEVLGVLLALVEARVAVTNLNHPSVRDYVVGVKEFLASQGTTHVRPSAITAILAHLRHEGSASDAYGDELEPESTDVEQDDDEISVADGAAAAAPGTSMIILHYFWSFFSRLLFSR